MLKREWYTSIPAEVHTLRVYGMSNGSSYIVAMRTVFTNPDYPCAVYHIPSDADWRFYVDAYGQFVTDGCIMRDYFRARDLVDIRNGIIAPNEDLGTCLNVIGEIIADGEILGSKAFVYGGRFGRTDIHTWVKVEG